MAQQISVPSNEPRLSGYKEQADISRGVATANRLSPKLPEEPSQGGGVFIEQDGQKTSVRHGGGAEFRAGT